MLVTLKEILHIAEEKKIAVGAFNVTCLEALEAELRAAEELQLPIIIQFAECHEHMTGLEVMGPVMVLMAKKASVPVCVHLDHGETPAYLKRALEIGFTGIMYDGSALSYEENVKNSRTMAELAHSFGASIEAELGSMGRRESGSGNDAAGADDETKIYTDPIQAADFVEKTGIDALACSFGTTHGIYLSAPKLDFDVVRNVRKEAGNIPVVMHGGSGVCAADYRKAVEAGVRKINYFTYLDKSGGEAAAEYVRSVKEDAPYFFSAVFMAAREAMKENVMEAMKVFAGK